MIPAVPIPSVAIETCSIYNCGTRCMPCTAMQPVSSLQGRTNARPNNLQAQMLIIYVISKHLSELYTKCKGIKPKRGSCQLPRRHCSHLANEFFFAQ